MLRQMGRDQCSTRIGLFAVMDAYKVHNDHTIYTGLMCPSTGYYIFYGNDGITKA